MTAAKKRPVLHSNYVIPDGDGWKIISKIEDWKTVGWYKSEDRAYARAVELDYQHQKVLHEYIGLIERLQESSRLPWHAVLFARVRRLVMWVLCVRS
jgi:hypothetical protein